MGLFDRFKKKKEDVKTESKEEVKQEEKATPSLDPIPELLQVTHTEQGSHGDNFGGMIGFEYLSSEEGGNFLNEHIAAATVTEPTHLQDGIALHDFFFQETPIGLRTLVSHGNMFSAYPYLKSENVMDFETKEILEWSHINGYEGELKGRGKETFGLGFFATDYAINKEKYNAEKEIRIRISAIALVMDEFTQDKIGDQSISDDFAAYMPNDKIPQPTYYDYIGKVNSVEPITLSEDISGYLCNVKLINQPDDPDFFNIDLFINQENMRIDTVTEGMRVTGALWFQGELAE